MPGRPSVLRVEIQFVELPPNANWSDALAREWTRTNIKCDESGHRRRMQFFIYFHGLTFISDNGIWYNIESRWNALRNVIKAPDPLNWKVSVARYFAFNFGRVCVCASCCPSLIPRKIANFFATSLSAKWWRRVIHKTQHNNFQAHHTQLSYTFGLLNLASLIPIYSAFWFRSCVAGVRLEFDKWHYCFPCNAFHGPLTQCQRLNTA